MTPEHTLMLVALLVLVEFAQPRLVGGVSNDHRLLGRWTFDEPCIAGPTFYENPAEGTSLYNDSLRQYSRIKVGWIYSLQMMLP